MDSASTGLDGGRLVDLLLYQEPKEPVFNTSQKLGWLPVGH